MNLKRSQDTGYSNRQLSTATFYLAQGSVQFSRSVVTNSLQLFAQGYGPKPENNAILASDISSKTYLTV